MRKLYVGIDIHSREHTVAAIPLAILVQPSGIWKKVKTFNIRNNIVDFNKLDTTLRSHITNRKEAAIAIDHTGGHYSEPLVCYLQDKGYSVYYLETKAIKSARERFLDEENKSDVIDSTSTAYMLYLRDLHGLSFRISAMTPEIDSAAAVLISLTLQRWQYNKLATQATNRLHQFLLAVFPEGESKYFNQLMKITPYYPTPKDILRSDNLKTIEKLCAKDRECILQLASNSVGVSNSNIYSWLIKDLSTQRIAALAKRDALTAILKEQVTMHPYGDILLSFPYVGEITAATIIGIIKDIERWPDKKKFKKALGVYNSKSQSGSSTFHISQGKEGNRHGRRVLFQVCFGGIKTNVSDNDFKDYYLRQVNHGKLPIKALVSTMGKLAEIIYHCLKAGEFYQYQGVYKTR